MSTPQQPELHRSKETPEMDLDNIAGELKGRDQPGRSGGRGRPVPEDNTQGHHPATEQDKPDLDKFAAKLGLVDDAPSPTDGRTDAAEPVTGPSVADASTPSRRRGIRREGARVVSSLENAGRAGAAASLALTARMMRLAADLVDRIGDDVAPHRA